MKVYHIPHRYQRNPRTRLQHLENMKIAFDFMEEEHVELVSMRKSLPQLCFPYTIY